MASGFRHITLERDGIAWRLTFERPERRNALNHRMMAEIGEAVHGLARNPHGARALVLRGRGGAFCAGGDLGAMSAMPKRPKKGPDPLVAPYRVFGDVLAELNALPLAVVSVVEGPAVGGGFGMVCASDVVLLHRSAIFGIPEPRSGFIPSQILPLMVRRLGEGAVRHLAVSGAILNAREALRLGLGQIVCASGTALERALADTVHAIGRMEPDALATVKRLVLMCAGARDEAVMDRAAEELVRLLRRPEARQGMKAFLDKAKPPWVD